MKNLSLILISLIALFSCKKINVLENKKSEIPFTGNWERSFDAGPGNTHTANYFVFQDSIRYTLQGSVGNANYLILRDTFIQQDNRFIGHTNLDEFYLLFVKQNASNTINIYKQSISSIAEGLSTQVPSDTSTQNHGWNTFNKL